MSESDPVILIAPIMKHVYEFAHDLGNWTFPDGFIIAESFEDAWGELADWRYAAIGECDHGDPDELKAMNAALEALGPPPNLPAARQQLYERMWSWVDEHCDCDSAPNGGRVWLVDYHLRQTDQKVGEFCKAHNIEWEEGWD